MKRTQTDSFVLKLPLRCELWQQDYLDKLFRVGGNLYNNLVKDRKNALSEMERTREWRAVQSGIAAVFVAIKEQGNVTPTSEQETQLQALYQHRSDMLKRYGFSDAVFQARIQKWRAHHTALIGTHVAQKVATAVWQKFEQYFYDNGKEIHFKPWTKFLSLENKTNGTGFRFRLSSKGYENQPILFVNKVAIPVEIPDTAYVREALSCRVKFCRIVRTPWYGKFPWLYTLQLVMEGQPPKKRTLGKGPVGIDIGTQTIAVVGDQHLTLEELAPRANLPNADVRRINRAMDRSRRAVNPVFFQKDGQVIPSDKLDPDLLDKRGKRRWNNSKRYEKLAQERRYLYAKLARIRRCQHQELSNRLLAYGDTFYVETMKFSALAKKAKPAETKTSGKKPKRRKRFGKSVANKAPALLIKLLEQKVIEEGGTFHRINTYKAKASQYDHTDNCYHKKKLSKRWTTLRDGTRIQRDLYSALLIQNTNKTLDGFLREAVRKRFPHFKDMHDIQMEALKHIHTPSSTGVARVG